MLLLQDEDEGDLVDSLIFEHVRVSRLNDFFRLVDADNFEGMVHVGNWDLLDLKDIIGVKDSFEVLSGQELLLELI